MKTSTEIAMEIAEKAAYDADEFMSIGYDSGDQFLVFDELGFTGHLAAVIEPMVREMVEAATAVANAPDEPIGLPEVMDRIHALRAAMTQPKEESGNERQ